MVSPETRTYRSSSCHAWSSTALPSAPIGAPGGGRQLDGAHQAQVAHVNDKLIIVKELVDEFLKRRNERRTLRVDSPLR
eukprot:CAMPEP_0185797414 /NCGR_PEP_ID=MMETSP1174-20130828/161602_1 /TAXON_ID=35687 /ORGANISM="Dictyocha speculum, Strain CCMP1381" /LENGTH=78 /DNA_ID=CAMNT_0028492845 /DNA_START=291 /DNA_END=526 /DNA_ORIENTATION=+